MHSQRRFLPSSLLGILPVLVAVATGVFPTAMQGQSARKNPASKIYFAEVSGDTLIDTGDRIEDVTKRTVYDAEGSVIETRRLASDDRARLYSTLVYSNGTGAFVDADTRVEVRRFVQEPFAPNRTDVDVEPSISQTQAFVSRGTVALCTSKLVAGSSMTYQTPHGSVTIRGRRVVIETGGNETKITMLEGDGTVRAGSLDVGGNTLKSGQQAIIRQGAPGQPNQIEIRPLNEADEATLGEKAAMACMAKQTVYFDAVELPGSANPFNAGEEVTRELVPIQTVPASLPVQFTVSPARLTTPGTGP